MKNQIKIEMKHIAQKLANLLVHPIKGKIIGSILIFVPILMILIQIITSGISLSKFLLLIILIYPGLFLGAIIHELGHSMTLMVIGCKPKFRVL